MAISKVMKIGGQRPYSLINARQVSCDSGRLPHHIAQRGNYRQTVFSNAAANLVKQVPAPDCPHLPF